MRETLHLQFFAEEPPSAQTDASAGAAAEEDASKTETSAEKSDADARFEALIKGEFADAFQKRTQKIINARFKKTKALETAEKELSALRQTLDEVLPDAAGKTAADVGVLLRQTLSAQRPGKEAAPSQEAPSEPPALQSQPENAAAQEKKLLASLKDTLLVRQKKARAGRILEDWTRQETALKALYPDFDLQASLTQNADFISLVKAGLPLRKAYEAANLEQILGSAMRYAALRGGQKTADFMRESGALVQENSVLDRASSLKTTDVNSLTQKDILRIIGEVNRGAKITFK